MKVYAGHLPGIRHSEVAWHSLHFGQQGSTLEVCVPVLSEAQIATLGATMIPVGQLEQRIGEIAAHKNDEVLVHCKSGARSQKASLILKQNGFTNVKNVAGGILAWAERIDPNVPKY